MLSQKDHDQLLQIMEESPEKRDLLNRLLTSHQITLSTFSHEVRNPLTLIYSTLQLIETRHPEVLSFDHWDDLHQDFEYLVQLLNELSLYNNGEKLHCTDVPMTTYLQKIALSYAASLTDLDIEFVSSIAPDLPVITLDEVKFRQTISNLLNNARDAVLSKPSANAFAEPSRHFRNSLSSEGSSPSIRLSALCTDASELLIRISDNGCGISEKDLPNIFQPFITHKENGTGLGLAVTERVIRAHHGSVEVESTSPSGTTFLLRLPVQQNTNDKSR